MATNKCLDHLKGLTVKCVVDYCLTTMPKTVARIKVYDKSRGVDYIYDQPAAKGTSTHEQALRNLMSGCGTHIIYGGSVYKNDGRLTVALSTEPAQISQEAVQLNKLAQQVAEVI